MQTFRFDNDKRYLYIYQVKKLSHIILDPQCKGLTIGWLTIIIGWILLTKPKGQYVSK